MQSRILAAISVIAALALVLVYAGTSVFFYQTSRDKLYATLENEGDILALSLGNRSEAGEITLLQEMHRSTPGIRLTLVAADGTVRYDTQFKASKMANHSHRPEIASALRRSQSGAGSDIVVRDSDTVDEKMIYYAKATASGEVLRVARPMRSFYATVLSGLPILAAIALAVFGLAFLIARHQSRRIVEPLNRLDLNHPLSETARDHDSLAIYPEFRPLLQRLEHQNQDKEAAARSRREFSANVSHELKTPLTSISGYAEIIQNGLVKPEDIPGFANRIHQESSRLLGLIGDIMELSLLDEGGMPEEAKEVDLFAVCRSVVERLQSRADSCAVSLHLSGTKICLTGVEPLLDMLVYNLVENAIKYNREGGKVEVWAGAHLGIPQLVVSDTGIGIPLEEQERVFERFYRVDKSHSKATGGTGLGLSIVKHAAILHAAEITVDSTPDEGTRIQVSFPHAV